MTQHWNDDDNNDDDMTVIDDVDVPVIEHSIGMQIKHTLLKCNFE